MIILRQREFGRTGLNKDQVKQFFKNGQGKINKAAKRNYEAGIGNKVAKHLIKTEKTIPEHKNGKSAAIYFGRQHEHQTDTPNLIDSIKNGVVKLKGDNSSIDHKVNIRGFENTNHLWNRPWNFGDDGRKTSIYLIKKHTDSSINHKQT